MDTLVAVGTLSAYTSLWWSCCAAVMSCISRRALLIAFLALGRYFEVRAKRRPGRRFGRLLSWRQRSSGDPPGVE